MDKKNIRNSLSDYEIRLINFNNNREIIHRMFSIIEGYNKVRYNEYYEVCECMRKISDILLDEIKNEYKLDNNSFGRLYGVASKMVSIYNDTTPLTSDLFIEIKNRIESGEDIDKTIEHYLG